MKNFIQIFIAGISILYLGSCGETNEVQQGDHINLESIINSKSTDRNAAGGNTCLLNYQQHYDQLVSEADVLRITGFSKDAMTTKYSQTLKDPGKHGYTFSWKHGRKGPILGASGIYDLPDYIKVQHIQSMSMDIFEKSYRPTTTEEKALVKDLVDDMAAGNMYDPEAQKAIAQAEQAGASQADIKRTGGTLTDMFQQVADGYRIVDGVGDAARWNVVTNELIVLVDGVKFEISVEVSNDTEANRKVALEVAALIIKKCK